MSLKNFCLMKIESEREIIRCKYCDKPYKLKKNGCHTKKFENHLITCKIKKVECNMIICDICWNDTFEEDTCSSICGHIFHKECIKNYEEDKCPMCFKILDINE